MAANERLRAAMMKSGLGLAELAEAAGVDPKTCERWVTQGRVPHRLNAQRAYSDGEVRRQFNICYTARIIGGELRISDESTAIRFTDPAELDGLPLHPTQRLRLRHYLEHQAVGTWERVYLRKWIGERRDWFLEQMEDRFMHGVPKRLR